MKSIMWGAYILAVVLTVLVKMLQFMHSENAVNVTFKASFANYFIGGKATSLSTITILGFEWLLGAVYIDHLPIVFGDTLGNLPTHPALAFLLGSLGEAFAPMGIKWLSNKIFPGG